VRTFPIGIDTDKVSERKKSPHVDSTIKAIGELYAGKKIIVGRDKLDLVKGVQQKLEAFEYFLSHYPEWHDRVVLVQATDPSISDSAKLETRVSEMVAHINGAYGSLQFTPLHHFHHFIQPDEYYALLSIADAALITSVRDGMNTTSFEYIMCQEDKKSPLILSEFTGTAGSLSEALLVNPWDHAGVAKAINDALCMSQEEKNLRHKVMHDHVISHKAEVWAYSFLKNLISGIAIEEESAETPLLNTKKMMEQYQKANKRLIFFDYDVNPVKLLYILHTIITIAINSIFTD
jgi:trehalose 6-phosphate synthase/phosphatase